MEGSMARWAMHGGVFNAAAVLSAYGLNIVSLRRVATE